MNSGGTFPTDEALMAAVRDGDSRKLGVLFDRHHRPLLDYFRRTTGDAAASQDLVQEVFLRMLKYRGTYQGAGHFSSWMYRIARNARIDHFKERRKEMVEEFEQVSDAPHWDNPQVRFEREWQASLLEAALYRLDADTRELIVFARYRQMPYAEIAEVLGIQTGAVKVRIHRALEELRSIFLKLAGEKTSCDAKKSAHILPTI